MEFNKRKSGHEAESLAVEYLRNKGYDILEQNYHYSRFGEVDIIARLPRIKTLVFVEVKSGNRKAFGSPLEKITPHKIKQIIRVAEAYLHFKRISDWLIRFDVIVVEKDGSSFSITHLEDAFRS